MKPALRRLFDVQEVKTLVSKINIREISTTKIASIAPIVFQHAFEGDVIAMGIIDKAAYDLAETLNRMIEISSISDCELHVWGGIFKSVYVDSFIEKKKGHLEVNCNLTWMNYSQHNVGYLYALKQIKFGA